MFYVRGGMDKAAGCVCVCDFRPAHGGHEIAVNILECDECEWICVFRADRHWV